MMTSTQNSRREPGHSPAVNGCPHAAAQSAMSRLREGHAQSFQFLYDAHADLVYSIAIGMLGHEEEAKEVLQDVFLKLWHAPELYEPQCGKVVSWFVIITRNRCRNSLRSGRRRAAIHEAAARDGDLFADAGANSADLLLRQETVAAVHAALAILPRAQYEAIRLTFLHGLTQEKTAAQLRLPLGTVKARIRRGLARLKVSLPLRHSWLHPKHDSQPLTRTAPAGRD